MGERYRGVLGSVFRDIRIAMGVPTMLLRPRTTQCFPSVVILFLFNNSIIPLGVAETYVGRPKFKLLDIFWTKPVDVFFRVNSKDDLAFVDMGWKW